MIILLDAGHSEGKAHNRGSVIGNEGDNNYSYSLVLKKALEKYKNVKVSLTRNKPSDNPSLASRGKKANGYDLFISLHSNATDNYKVRGVETFDDVTKRNQKLATLINDSIAKVFSVNRGVKYKVSQYNHKEDYYGVLRSNGAKYGMLIEHGFHTNYDDCYIYVNKREEIANATVKAIAEYYGLELKTKKTVYNKKLTKIETYYYYIINGTKKDGFQVLDGYKYYFRKKTGTMAIGWQYIDNNWYYFRETGTMTKGWQYVKGVYDKDYSWYYFRESGTLATGMQFIGGAWKYLDNYGRLKANVKLDKTNSPFK